MLFFKQLRININKEKYTDGRGLQDMKQIVKRGIAGNFK